MLSFVARLRHLAPLLLFLTPLVSGRADSLFTSSVTYCSEPDVLLIQQFDVTYFQKNSSVWFNISAASVQPDVNVSANIFLNVYGMHPINFTIDLCSLFNGALCPLPNYNFTGSDSISLPSSLGVSQKIPDIAFKIPDLEAYVQLSLTEVDTGAVKACVQATLSNGWSARQVGVEWAIGVLGLLALFSAIWFSPSPTSRSPFRFLDLFYLYQWAASTALLDLNYPSVYRAFATNFAWTMGLFSASADSLLQQSINNMRHLTGGTMADASGDSAVAFVDRKLSPYNAATAAFVATSSQFFRRGQGNLLASALANRMASATSGVQQLDTAGTVQLVTSSSSNVLQAGIPIYVNFVGIATANAFMTIFLVALMVLAILLAALAIGYGMAVLNERHGLVKASRLLELKQQYPAFTRAWLLRVCLLMFTPVTIFAMYQWTLKDSWLSVLFSVVLLLAVTGYLLCCGFVITRAAVRDTPYMLYSPASYLRTHGPLFALYRTGRYYTHFLLLAAVLVKAIFTAFAHANGEVQIIAILLIEVAVLVLFIFLRPHNTRGADALAIYLAITRVVCTGLLVAFVEQVGLSAIPRVIIGIVAAVFISIAVIVMFVNILVNMGIPVPFRRRSTSSTKASALEKGSHSYTASGRPANPTPEHVNHRDPVVNQLYPGSPSKRSVAECNGLSEESGSTTLGSLLPRRWSLESHFPNNSLSQH